MITLSITISKARVVDEVQMSSAYVGTKSVSEKDPDAYERIAAVDAEREQLERYWMEACTASTTAMSHWLVDVTDQMLGHHYDPTRDYHVELSLPSNWNDKLAHAVKEALMSHLINVILTRWLLLTGAPDMAKETAADAVSALKLLDAHLLDRKRPSSRLSGGSGSGGDGGGGQCDCRKHVILTQEEYDNLTVIDEDTIYLIYEDV